MTITKDPTFITSESQRREKQTVAKRKFKDVAENFLNLAKDIT